VLPQPHADRAIELSKLSGIQAWRIGEVMAEAGATLDPAAELVRGAKGVDGGAVQVVGQHPKT